MERPEQEQEKKRRKRKLVTQDQQEFELGILGRLLELATWVSVQLAQSGEYLMVFFVRDDDTARRIFGKPSASPRNALRHHIAKFFVPVSVEDVSWLSAASVTRPSRGTLLWHDPAACFTSTLVPGSATALAAIQMLHLLRTARLAPTVASAERQGQEASNKKNSRARAWRVSLRPEQVLPFCWTVYIKLATREERWGTKRQWREHARHAASRCLGAATYDDAMTKLRDYAYRPFVSAAIVLERDECAPSAKESRKLASLLVHLGNAALWMDRDQAASDELFQLAYKVSGAPRFEGNVYMRMCRYQPPARTPLRVWIARLSEPYAYKIADAANMLAMGLRLLATEQLASALTQHASINLSHAVRWLDLALALVRRGLPEHIVLEARIRSNYARLLLLQGLWAEARQHAHEATRLVSSVPWRGTHFLQESIFHIRFTNIMLTPRAGFQTQGTTGEAHLSALCEAAIEPMIGIYGQDAPVVLQFERDLNMFREAVAHGRPFLPPA